MNTVSVGNNEAIHKAESSNLREFSFTLPPMPMFPILPKIRFWRLEETHAAARKTVPAAMALPHCMEIGFVLSLCLRCGHSSHMAYSTLLSIGQWDMAQNVQAEICALRSAHLPLLLQLQDDVGNSAICGATGRLSVSKFPFLFPHSSNQQKSRRLPVESTASVGYLILIDPYILRLRRRRRSSPKPRAAIPRIVVGSGTMAFKNTSPPALPVTVKV